ncbi:septum site-determining protein Ssd [Geodermatophilus marinus]|uniref:septum site-determining protein Ssd n=1 Tax=Geodermatophilus sp. LHW52908 TaxID=2303986 RepID=UPI000E3E9830|nr:septum site-determining protein Ssd [Geodermatophilus sp. LHW52908]RFU22229.1 septum formation initiator [Geodermatophilus sp. LHW52908]
MTAARTPPVRPLVVSADEDLLDDLLRVLAAAGTDPELATGGPALRRAHREASLVLLGADLLTAAAVRALPRRPGLVVVARSELPARCWAAAVERGAERVAVLPDDEEWLLARAAAAGRGPVQRGPLLVVGASSGGAGASTLATAAAAALAGVAGRALLVDTDAAGGGLDLVLGAEGREGSRWPELSGLRGRVGGEALLAALPEVGGVGVLACSRGAVQPVDPEAVVAAVDAARSAGCPVVVDLHRAAGRDVEDRVLAEADLAVLLVAGRVRSATAARMLLGAGAGPGAPPAWAPARVVLRRVPGGLGAAEVAAAVGRPVFAELGHDRGTADRGERGLPPAAGTRTPVGRLARRLCAELAAPEEAA